MVNIRNDDVLITFLCYFFVPAQQKYLLWLVERINVLQISFVISSKDHYFDMIVQDRLLNCEKALTHKCYLCWDVSQILHTVNDYALNWLKNVLRFSFIVNTSFVYSQKVIHSSTRRERNIINICNLCVIRLRSSL